MKKTIFFQILGSLGALFISQAVSATPVEAFQLYDQGLTQVSLVDALKQVKAGDIVIMGEQHGTQVQAEQQSQILQALKAQGLRVSLGMEFFEKPQQPLVDAMRSGQLSEAEFLSQIAWSSGTPYSAYRTQVNTPMYPNEYVVALNAPRSLTSRISKVGIEGLDAAEKALLPVDFEIGNEAYLERFQEIMGSHVPAAAISRYFQAQSTWDDVMATTSVEFLKDHPDQVLVIIVGEFHVQYGGGLPDRLKKRLSTEGNLSSSQIKTFSLINLDGMSQDEREEFVRPSSKYGKRADFVWTSQF